VAGLFYPADPRSLRTAVRRYLDEAAAPSRVAPKAMIVPHAGYVYSGPVAATAYRALESRRAELERVVLLGPSHYVPFDGLAAPSSDEFSTPLGEVPLDRVALESVRDLPQVVPLDAAHAEEHSLEVQLPFLQEILGCFELIPLAVGNASPADVGEVLERLWGGPETVVVVSSDLSHYQDYETARRLDLETARAIEELEPERLGPEDACGCQGIRGLLTAARRHQLEVRRVDLRSSGDTAGPHDRVVGYGAFLFVEPLAA
jgi:AmmeMemoRadiSam system protein B